MGWICPSLFALAVVLMILGCVREAMREKDQERKRQANLEA